MTDTFPTLLAWLENDLPEEESQLLNTHVADCDECREKLTLMSAVQDAGRVWQQARREGLCCLSGVRRPTG